MSISYLNSSLNKILTESKFSMEQIEKVVAGGGMDKAETPAELWAQWYATHCNSYDELFGERGITDPKLVLALRTIIDHVRSILTDHQK